MKRKKLPNRVLFYSFIVVSFCLAILDMFFLRDVFLRDTIKDSLDFGLVGASIASLALATAANVTALLWGRQKGQRESYKSFMFGWMFLGIAYAAIRAIPFIEDVVLCEDWSIEAIMGQLVPAIILAISYIGTGTLIQWSGSVLWDYDVMNYLETRKAHKEAHTRVINNRAIIQEMTKRLEEYENNYKSLDRQYDIHLQKIQKNEKSTMALIVAKTIADYPEITPSAAEEIMNKELNNRERKNERTHSKQK